MTKGKSAKVTQLRASSNKLYETNQPSHHRTRTCTELELVSKRTRKGELLDEMNLVTPWMRLLGLIVLHSSAAKTSPPPRRLPPRWYFAFIFCSSLGIPTRPWKRPCMTPQFIAQMNQRSGPMEKIHCYLHQINFTNQLEIWRGG